MLNFESSPSDLMQFVLSYLDAFWPRSRVSSGNCTKQLSRYLKLRTEAPTITKQKVSQTIKAINTISIKGVQK